MIDLKEMESAQQSVQRFNEAVAKAARVSFERGYTDGFADGYKQGQKDAQLEIIRCKDCKHYKEWESEFTPNAVVTQCMADNFPIRKAIPDGWFCAGAERREE